MHSRPTNEDPQPRGAASSLVDQHGLAVALAASAPNVDPHAVVRLLVDGDEDALDVRELDALHAWVSALVEAGPLPDTDPGVDEQLRLWVGALEAMS